MKLEGNIISGDFDELQNEFSLQKVKHLYSESTLKASQLNSLYDYLHKHIHEVEGQIITLYDQMPVHLSQEEIIEFVGDLEVIRSMYH